MINIKSYFHSPKIVWIDTNVVNDFADFFVGKDINNTEKQRTLSLYSKLQELVDRNKIICPFLNQRDEYINTGVYAMCDEVLLKLGKGKQLKTYLTTHCQIKRMLKLYIENRSEFYLEKSDVPFYYENNNKNDNNKENDLDFSIIVLQTGQNKEGKDKINGKLINHLTRRKEYIAQNNFNKDKVLKEEMFVRKTIFENAIKEIKNIYGHIFINFDYLSFDYCNIYPLIAYKEIKNKNKINNYDIEYVSKFLNSEEYVIPYDEIFSKIITKILTNNSNIKKTDCRDVESISLILPYASIMITDKTMKSYVQQLKLDQKYNTSIFSLKEVDKILDELEKI